ncbi:MAG: prepilin-type N-terminal cleavage/methylation domain-containing protein [Patescibacteria group bacterium]
MIKAEQEQKRDVRVETLEARRRRNRGHFLARKCPCSTRISLFCSCSAFTLMEVLVVLAITTIIATISVASFAEFSKREALDASATAIVAGLRDARAETLASVGGLQYGIAVSPDKFIFFQGTTYDSLATTNKIFNFSPYVRASSSISTVVFQRLTGNSTASGTIDVYLISDPTVKRTISIGGTGFVNIQK